jgi:uncharacterized protein with ParB-like and HNH nuclease domain
MNTSQLLVKPINDLLGEKFFVPSYQRGYRWTPIQVKELLNDIWDFHRKPGKLPEEFYCLQPIVVTYHNGEWELIDGQQRLTTIFLILQYLKPFLMSLRKESYSIRYQTRKESENFLQDVNVKLSLEDDNIDYYHFCQAYKTIDEWFKSKDGAVQFHFLTTLTNNDEAGMNVKVIWYEVGSEVNAIDIFTRINIGKIPLNNAELIRALFLRKGNFDKPGGAKTSLKQLQIGTEWDIIENTLQQDAFWFFIYEGKKEYSTRIEYIFDLMKKKKEDDEDYFTFHEFNKQFEEVKDIDKIWLEIKRFFQTFKDWFNNDDFYHLIGYLIGTGSSILELKTKSEGLSKTDFRDFLTTQIKRKVQFQIDELEYGDKEVKPLLLLFNIQTIVNNTNSQLRFPFHKYKDKNNGWDIEHIRSVKSDKPFGKKQREWLQNVLEYFTGLAGVSEEHEKAIGFLKEREKELAREVYAMLLQERIMDADFTTLYDKLLTHFGEDKEPENINSISNLALLDASTNRSYKNAVFPVKRKTIIKKDREGTFVPICTKNVFLKSYSNKVDNIMYWQEQDASDYLNAILTSLSIYLPTQTLANAHTK